jgi:hypothetical protein
VKRLTLAFTTRLNIFLNLKKDPAELERGKYGRLEKSGRKTLLAGRDS